MLKKNGRMTGAPGFGTMSKGARIEAFLESMGDGGGNRSGGEGSMTSDDSLEGIPLPSSVSAPSSSRHRPRSPSKHTPTLSQPPQAPQQSELLQQLKSRLKKTTSENSQSFSTSTIGLNACPSTGEAHLRRPEPKPRKLDRSPPNDSGPPKEKTAVVRSLATTRKSGSEEKKQQQDGDELSARIKLLKPVAGVQKAGGEASDGPYSTTTSPHPMVGVAKVRQLVTQKVAPLQHHRPFSIQEHQPDTESNNQCNQPAASSLTASSSSTGSALTSSSAFVTASEQMVPPMPALVRPFATLQRSPASKDAPAVKPRKTPSPPKAILEQAWEDQKGEMPPPDPSTTNSTSAQIARAQSLRDPASTLEKISTVPPPPSQHHPQYSNGGKPLIGLRPTAQQHPKPAADKRYSMLETCSTPLETVGLGGGESATHETPSPSDKPAISKDLLVELDRRLSACIQELRSENGPRKVAALASRLASLGGTGQAGQGQQQPAAHQHHTTLIQLSDLTQQFHDTCTIYAENISPHSKFRYR